ncbi:MAG: hypothetical protein WB789_05475 [Thermoplasmata archaeon]
MESITVEKNETVAQKIVDAPVKVGKVVVAGTETLGHDVKKGVVEGVTVIADATTTAARDIGEAGKELGRDAKTIASPRSKPETTPAASSAAAPSP